MDYETAMKTLESLHDDAKRFLELEDSFFSYERDSAKRIAKDIIETLANLEVRKEPEAHSEEDDIREQRWKLNRHIHDNETVRIWIDDLLESKGKMRFEELTAEELLPELENTRDSIAWGDKHAIIDSEDYIELIENRLEELK